MQDEEIVGMFFNRDENALNACREKYGRYLSKVAYNVLGDTLDCEEALSDALLGAWRAIPPNNPADLKTFLTKLTRRSAVDILRSKTREKRRVTEYSISIDELSEVIPGNDDPAGEAEVKELGIAINSWLSGLKEEQRTVFLLRYYYSEPVSEISKRLSVSESKVKSILFRLRNSLKAELEKECYL